MSSVLSIKTKKVGRHCIGSVTLGKGEVTTRHKVALTEKDCERMAMLISTEKMLALVMNSRIVPLPLKGALALVQQLLALKHRQMLGEKGAKANLEKTLAAAKKSPVRAVRAVAAAIEEYLK